MEADPGMHVLAAQLSLGVEVHARFCLRSNPPLLDLRSLSRSAARNLRRINAHAQPLCDAWGLDSVPKPHTRNHTQETTHKKPHTRNHFKVSSSNRMEHLSFLNFEGGSELAWEWTDGGRRDDRKRRVLRASC
eukprot:3517440-Rhodomonas_salina.3